MAYFTLSGKSAAASKKKKALVICAHLRPGRTKRRSRHFMQPLSGLHIASLIDSTQFDVKLYHEQWHGPYCSSAPERFDIVFLSGLQPDFDRMRQLSYHFRKVGSIVVAGGSICTLFPEFASQFFDVVCVGGVDTVPDIITDFSNGSLKPIYRNPISNITTYTPNYRFFRENGIRPSSHLVEASRGCSFKCSFCVIPAEVGHHATYDLEAVKRAIDNSIEESPFFSIRRWVPTIFFLDNNFADDKSYMLEIADLLLRDKRIKAWGALVTQDILHDRDLILRLRRSKCRMLFIGLESLNRDFLRRYNKKQNLSRRSDIVEDILFSEKNGVAVSYGYLCDPRLFTARGMEDQIADLFNTLGFPFPTYFSFVAPLVGTAAFWMDASNGELAPNLRLRDLEGETIAYSCLRDDPGTLRSFAERISRRPWSFSTRKRLIASTLRRVWNCLNADPFHWWVVASANFHGVFWLRTEPSRRESYFSGEDILDPQYNEYPAGISRNEWEKYFRPIQITDHMGNLVDWIHAYSPSPGKERRLPKTHRLAANHSMPIQREAGEA